MIGARVIHTSFRLAHGLSRDFARRTSFAPEFKPRSSFARRFFYQLTRVTTVFELRARVLSIALAPCGVFHLLTRFASGFDLSHKRPVDAPVWAEHGGMDCFLSRIETEAFTAIIEPCGDNFLLELKNCFERGDLDGQGETLNE